MSAAASPNGWFKGILEGGAGSRAPQLAALAGAALAAAQAALLVFHLLPGRNHPKPVAPPPLPPPAVDLQALLAAPLFGAATQAPVDGAEAPRTNVALVLTGTLAVRDPKQGLAIVGETAPTARVYAVGASLPGGVRLHEVFADRVVLDRGGVLETLPLPRELTGAATTMAHQPMPPRGAPLAPVAQRILSQGAELIGEILRPMPAYANGQLRGFTIYPGRDRRKFARLGLQPGDLVTQINGVPLSDAQRGMEILRGLGTNGSSQVSIERGGVSQVVSLDTSQLDALTQPQAPAAASAEEGFPASPPPAPAPRD